MNGDQPYVRPPAVGKPDRWTAEDQRRHGQRLLEAGPAVPPEPVAAALGIAPDVPAIVRRRVMLVDEQPVELTDSWYPVEIAAGTALAEPRRIKGGAVRALADLGHVTAEVIEDVTAVDLDPEIRQQYGLDRSSPVLALTRVSLDTDGRPIEVAVMHMLAGQHLTYRSRI
jgi:DNA-binding GntR family transcriptional regulator